MSNIAPVAELTRVIGLLHRDRHHDDAEALEGVREEVVRMRAVVNLLADDLLADAAARTCLDPYHDARHCSTCGTRRDGIEEYRRVLRLAAEAAREAKP